MPRNGPRTYLLLMVILALSASGSVRHTSRLRVATWNIAWLNHNDSEGEIPRNPADYGRLQEYARRLDADIVALQEVDGKEAALRVFDPAVYAFHFTSDEGYLQRTGFAYKRGLRVLPQPDLFELAIAGTRRAADIEVDVDGRRLRLLSVHLKSGCWDDPLETDTLACNILRKQLAVLEEWVDCRAQKAVAFAVLGDFNRRFTPKDAFWAELDDSDPPNANLVSVTEGHTSQCWEGEYPLYVDHIVLDKHAASWLLPASFQQLLYDPVDTPHKATLSDHCPLAITLATGSPP